MLKANALRSPDVLPPRVSVFKASGWPAGDFGVSLAVRWRIPPSLVPGPVRHCVTATDPSGNRGRDCKQVLVSKA
jgi:hypothetical protein